MSSRENAGARRPNALLIIAGVSLMIVLDGAIVNIALPSMGRYFHRSQTDMTWAVNAYTLAFGGLLLLGGRAADIVGRRRVLVTGLTLFVAGSLAAGLATSFEFLLTGRVVQGVGAAIASPTALSLITTEFTEGPTRNRAIGVYAAISSAGAVVGLLLGGALTDYLSWRWVLFVNVPLGVALIFGTLQYVGDSAHPARGPAQIDYVGSVLSVAAIAGLVYGFIDAANDGWRDGETVLVLCLAVVLLAAFVGYEAFVAAEPIVAIRIFSDRNRSGAYLIIVLVGAALFGVLYFFTFYLQGVLGFSALEAGFAFLPAAVVVVISTQVSATLMPRVGPRLLLVVGTIVLTAALLWVARVGPDSGYIDTLLPRMTLVAIGLGAVSVPLTAVVMTRVTDTDAGLAAAVLHVGQQLGGSVGLAVLASAAATEATGASKTEGSRLIAQYGLSDHLLNFVLLGKSFKDGSTPPPAATLDPIARHAIDVVQASAYGAGFQTAAIFGAVALLASLVLITVKKSDLISIR